MQPTHPEVPSTDQPAPGASQDQAASEPTEETSSPPPWWRRMFRGRPGSDEGSAEESQEPAETKPAADTITLTQGELEKRIEAETDRREAKRAARALAERRKQLRDTDPWAYVEEERKVEQEQQSNEQLGTFFANIGAEHDKYTLDPVVQSLPQDEQQRILKLEGAGVGLDGRKLIVTESLKALEKHWKAEGARDAEAKLRRNSAFRKQLLNEIRGQTREPDFLPSGNGSSESSQGVSDILRQQLGSRKSL